MGLSAWIKDSLETGGARYQADQHKPTATAQEMAQQEHVSGHRVAKVVAVLVDSNPMLLVLPASRKVLLGKIKETLGDHDVRLMTESEMARLFPDCEVGAIPPLRHWQDVDIWVDKTLGTEKEIVFNAGTHTDAVRMAYEEWKRLVQPREEDFTALGEWADVDSHNGEW